MEEPWGEVRSHKGLHLYPQLIVSDTPELAAWLLANICLPEGLFLHHLKVSTVKSARWSRRHQACV